MYNGESDYDPIDDFDIQVCDTYENLWLWDLSLSCNNATEADLSSRSDCNCTFAQELMDNGLLMCSNIALCPGDCAICSTCMTLLGCDPGPNLPKRISRLVSTPVMLYIIGAAVAMLLFGLAAYYSRRKWQDDRDLNRNLIEKEKHRELSDAALEDTRGPSIMYIHGGDMTWRPLPSDREFAAQQTIQPTGTMSTASTGKYFLEEKQAVPPVQSIRAIGRASNEEQGSLSFSQNGTNSASSRFDCDSPRPNEREADDSVPFMVDASENDIDDRAVSPINTCEDESISSSSNEEHHVFEDNLSPTSLEGGEQKFANE